MQSQNYHKINSIKYILHKIQFNRVKVKCPLGKTKLTAFDIEFFM